MTFRYAAFAIQESLKKTGDDSDVQIPLILFYLSVVANRINARDLKKGIRSGKHLAIFNNVQVQMDDELGLYYIVLPEDIIETEYEGGIEFITYNVETCKCDGPQWAQVSSDPVTAGELRVIYGDPIEKPSVKQPYHYIVGCRVDDNKGYKVFLAGPECITLHSVKVGLYCPVNPAPCDLDSKIAIKSSDEDELIRETINLIRWVQLVPEESINDGADMQQAPEQPTSPIPQQDQYTEDQ
jgi:hypothetical protein